MSQELFVCRSSELRNGSARVVPCIPPVAVFRVKGHLFAIADLCTHAEASLGEGYLDEANCIVECPLHGAQFSLETGQALTQPAYEPVATYPVIEKDECIYVSVEP